MNDKDKTKKELLQELATLRQRLAELETVEAERRGMEERVKRSETRLRQIIDLVPHLIFAKDWDGRFILVNQGVADLFGSTVEDIVGKTDIEAGNVFSEKELADFLEQDRQIIKSGETLSFEERLEHEDGAVSFHRTIKIPFEVLDTGEPAVLGIAMDITEIKEAEVERARLQQAVIEAQKEVIHELSTPIIPIMDGIIIMPLVGSFDTARAQDTTRALLAGITQYHAKVVIIDVTGVAVIDTGVANHMTKTIQAARLKGTHTIVTGISEAVAETIVDLGIDWSNIDTLTNLQTGLNAAIHKIKN
jgi:rsbT co-antagonist protein RsbR